MLERTPRPNHQVKNSSQRVPSWRGPVGSISYVYPRAQAPARSSAT